ncbi:hypothetical protein [Dactylosporangium sp. NPDC051541]|uniref:hypothetical protein n=1 Tax=Dactylosporangium sp. NPDC051541 TaxID=3363977 RepID=UPI00378ED183
MLRYRVEPDRVACSAPGRPSVVALTVIVTNLGDGPVACPQLRLLVSNDQVPKPAALTTDPSTITVTPGARTPWAVGTDGEGLLFALPLPPATGVPPGGHVEVHLGDLVVGPLPGPAQIVVRGPDGTAHTLTVHKEARPPAEGEPADA